MSKSYHLTFADKLEAMRKQHIDKSIIDAFDDLASYLEQQKDTPSLRQSEFNKIVAEHFLHEADAILKNKDRSIEEIHQSENVLNLKLAGKPPIEKKLKMLVGAIFGALILASIGVAMMVGAGVGAIGVAAAGLTGALFGGIGGMGFGLISGLWAEGNHYISKRDKRVNHYKLLTKVETIYNTEEKTFAPSEKQDDNIAQRDLKLTRPNLGWERKS